MSHSLTLPGNKDAVTPNPPHERRKPSYLQLMTSAYQDQLNAGFSKVCEIYKVCGIESLKYVRHGRALANESCHGFQTFSRQSEGLATRD